MTIPPPWTQFTQGALPVPRSAPAGLRMVSTIWVPSKLAIEISWLATVRPAREVSTGRVAYGRIISGVSSFRGGASGMKKRRSWSSGSTEGRAVIVVMAGCFGCLG